MNAGFKECLVECSKKSWSHGDNQLLTQLRISSKYMMAMRTRMVASAVKWEVVDQAVGDCRRAKASAKGRGRWLHRRPT